MSCVTLAEICLMSLRNTLGKIVSTVGTVALAVILMSPGAHAQDYDDGSSFWGGTKKWGGGLTKVRFDKKYTPGQIIVSFGDRRLYFINKRGQALSYPVAVPKESERWQGKTVVSQKKKNPSWTPTPYMLRKNPRLPSWVPGGHPMNPLGVRALYLGTSTYRIHGTDAPWTIGKAVSAGCIRMFNKDVLDLYPRIPVGTKVTVTWKRYKTRAGEFADAKQRRGNRRYYRYSRSRSSRTAQYR
jgi:lipoprotein-anchoring transpeptidase ErfK/SrfK